MSWSNAFLPQIASRLQDGIEVRDRMYRLKTYKRCLVASEAVDFMVEEQIVNSREEAVKIGRRLQKKMGLWHHICDDHDFDDAYLFFRFSEDDTEVNEEGVDEREYTDDEIYDIAENLKVCLDVEDRTYRFKTYKKCFIASEAINVMVENEMANSREEAILLGRHLQKELNLWNHVCDDHLFDDKYFFFRFTSDNDECVEKEKKTKKWPSRLSLGSNTTTTYRSESLSYSEDDPVYEEYY